MDGRTSAWLLTVPLTMLCAGCLTTQGQKNVTTPGTTSITHMDDVPRAKKDDGPKRNPLPSTEIAFGEMKESEADSKAAKENPEAQARLRDEARQAYQQALRIDKNNLDAFRHLGRVYTKMNDFERAQDVYKQALAKYPKDAALCYDFGLCHNRHKDLGESARWFRKALELDPENREYLKKLGYTLAMDGHIDQGLIYLTRAYGSATAHFKIACVFDQKNNPEQAIQQLRIALRENSQLQEARDLLTALENAGANPGWRGPRESSVSGG